ncbi:MAG: biotin carboxylase N-terminal domain-containing protein, partial [Acetobacteraceae bacterium]
MSIAALLIANRGEIAIRIARSASELGIRTIGVFSDDDSRSLHVRRMDAVQPLRGTGAAAYLNVAGVIEAARAAGCDAIHPGYGFLSENAAFARACAEAGLTFVGPTPDTLDLFGDKTAARALAARCEVPVAPGSAGPVTLDEARTFLARHGAMMIKAVGGGGGRGMRAVFSDADLTGAYERCRAEAGAAFGVDGVYVEALIADARHIEVQIVGDGTGAVVHLGERECSLQRRHQKIFEIAPSPSLSTNMRRQVTRAAVRMAQAVRYRALGTFEFLVSGDAFHFIEANAR